MSYKTLAASFFAVFCVAVSPSNASSIITCDQQGCRASQTVAGAVSSRHRHLRSESRNERMAARTAKGDTPSSGIIRSGKTGATARVAVRYAGVFQAYVDAVEAAGGRITFMGGIRPGRCAIPWSKHPCGMALDLCQYSRGVVDHRCELPSERTLAAIAESLGLVEGGIWCHGDRGHAEIRTDRQAEGCGHNLYAAVEQFKRKAR